jgi:L-ascorbate metabolism protein UlaG (beta-lactamase superfamily)
MASFYERIFPKWRKESRFRPEGTASEDDVKLTWLGTASFVVRTKTTTVLVDPYLTRVPLLGLPFSHEPDERAIFSALPARVDAIVCGHSHYDHVADAPRIAKRTGALLVGSESTCAWGAAEGLDESRLVRVSQRGGTVTVGDVVIRLVPSRHGKALFHRVPFPGSVEQAPRLPKPIWAYKMGGAFGVLLKTPGLSIYHNGSADLVDAELEGLSADVLLACLAGRRGTPSYLKRLVDHLSPGLVVPTHHDAFFAPLSRGVHLLPGIDLPGFLSECTTYAPRATRVTVDYQEELAVPRGDARGAVVVPSYPVTNP